MGKKRNARKKEVSRKTKTKRQDGVVWLGTGTSGELL
jgi:hypothetical protein